MGIVDQHRDAHAAINRRDWVAVVKDFAQDAEYTDRPRDLTSKGPAEFVDYLRDGWLTSFSDATVNDVHYLDAGDKSIALFTGSGTQDGQLGPFPPSGKRMTHRFCEIMHAGSDGKIIGGEIYYDQMSMLVQLGHLEAPPG